MELARLKAFKPTTPAGTAAATAAGVVGASLLARQVYRSYCGASKASDKWSHMLEEVLPAIVVIQCNYVRPFDGDVAGSAHATGFVVDAERGIILTNRRVVSTGPVRAEATFNNKEEVRTEIFPISLFLTPCDLSLSLLSHPPSHPMANYPPPQLLQPSPVSQKVVSGDLP